MKRITACIYLVLCAAFCGIQGMAQDFTKILKGYEAYNRFWGSILVVQNHHVVFQANNGFANIDLKIPNDTNALYNLASVSKTLTAAAIFKLHDQGKLSVFDRVDKYLPGFIDADSKNIRIINLLNHTSGMEANICQSDDQGNGLVLPDNKPVSRDSMLAKFCHTKLKFVPGTEFEYNNYGYVLLAYIIEKVSGDNFATYMQHEICQPAGMYHTFFKSALSEPASTGYAGIGTIERKPVTAQEYDPSWIMGAGGMYASVTDMSKFIDAVFSNRFFSENTRHLMLDSCVNSTFPNVQWTLGWEKQTFENETYYAHSGSDNGYSTKIIYMPSKKLSIIILSNLVRDLTDESIKGAKFSFVEDISENILQLMFQQQVEFLPLPAKNTDLSICGSYQLDSLHTMKVFSRNDTLMLSFCPLSIFDYSIHLPLSENSENMNICRKFSDAIVSGNLEGFEVYVSDDLKANLFNKEAIGRLTGGWNFITAQSGAFQSYTIYKVDNDQSSLSYHIAYHFEKSEVLMVLTFNAGGIIQGLFILNILPRCAIVPVQMYAVGENHYFVDGYHYGGYPDFRITFDPVCHALNFKSYADSFSAVKSNNL